MEKVKLYFFPIQKDGTYEGSIKHDASHDIIGQGGIGTIKSSIDNNDFSVGSSSYSSCMINLLNHDGQYSVPRDNYNSIFTNGRRNSRAEIYYIDRKGTERIIFIGLVNNETAQEDFIKETIKITLISLDYLFNQLILNFRNEDFRIDDFLALEGQRTIAKFIRNVIETAIRVNGYSYKRLPYNDIVDLDNIENSLGFNFGFDLWTVLPTNYFQSISKKFQNKSVKNFLQTMLLITNSFSYFDLNKRKIIITSREKNNIIKKVFYSQFDQESRNPKILEIKEFKSGAQRIINNVGITYTDIKVVFAEKKQKDTERLGAKEFVANSGTIIPDRYEFNEEDYVESENQQNQPSVTMDYVLEWEKNNPNKPFKGKIRLVKSFEQEEKEVFSQDNDSIASYGVKTKEIDLKFLYSFRENLDFVGYDTTLIVNYNRDNYTEEQKKYASEYKDSVIPIREIANNLVNNYSVQKEEMVIVVSLEDAYDLQIGDIISLDYTRKTHEPIDGPSVYGDAVYGENSYGGESGGLSISSDIGLIVYSVNHNLSKLTSIIKLREYGKTSTDSRNVIVSNGYETGRYNVSKYS